MTEQSPNDAFHSSSFLQGHNAAYMEQLYARYANDPHAVDESWRAFFEALGGDALNELIVEHTHTCYLGDRSQRHDWGHGCGQCPACELRRSGWLAWHQTLHPEQTKQTKKGT